MRPTLKLSSPFLAVILFVATSDADAQASLNDTFARDSHQRVDQSYTDAIRKYTTDLRFLSHLVDYLPASDKVPTPAKALGDIAGAPDMLPYAEEVYKYFRQLQATSPRVRVVSVGQSEEGREMIAVAIADESLLKTQKENDARLAKLADPRSLGLDDSKAQPLIDQSYPVYYITGTIHSTETGAPTALMELAYRLAVDDAPYIKYIRSHMIVLITPVVEVDGRDRMVDTYRWHKAHPGQDWPRLAYWGHYVAHDNNRDAMGMTLNLTKNVLNTYLGWHAQVLHDLHESVPFLYDNTVGDGPYNAWIDPTLADEWAELGWNNVAQMQSFGMPGVFTHGDFDTWSPGYLMFLAGLHNGISRLYETFGNGGADTEKRILQPEEYSRTWYRQNPPLPTVVWSQRDNNNYEESALLSTLAYFSHNTHHFLENYYFKSKRAIQKPILDGPSAYLLPANPAELNRQLQLLAVLKLQHVEVQQLTSSVTSSVPAAKRDDKPTTQTFPEGSYVIRLDQPFSRVADALLDRQYWAPDDPQRHPYDDTGWSFSQLFNVKAVRLTDPAILHAPMTSMENLSESTGKITGAGTVYAIANTGQTSILPFIYNLKEARIETADRSFDAEGRHFAGGTLFITKVDEQRLVACLQRFSLDAVRLGSLPDVEKHVVRVPRIAFMHTWLDTQTEGWWRLAFDKAGIPYSYISTQAAAQSDLHDKYDVIVFAPVGRSSSREIIDGMPQWGNALPWQKTELTPNLGMLDSTPDMRPGLGYEGLSHLRSFVEHGGLLITCEDTAQFAIDSGLAPGVSMASHDDVRVVGSVLSGVFVAPTSPIANGYGSTLPVMSANGTAFNVSDTLGHQGGRTLMDPYEHRPTGRGGPDENDIVQGRQPAEPETLLKQQPWQPKPLNEDQIRNNLQVIPIPLRPEVILRFEDQKNLLLSGLLDKAASIAEHAIVVNAHLGSGNVLLFANNPVYRGETIGSYALVFNAILNFDHLRQPVVTAAPNPVSEKASPAPGTERQH
ncbi:M14 family zinc carboxypeptidase [Granulicella sp. S190]|uniref:M14 family zinc carboxypeptidase n=1 Tax=Granulicella sp. S190 TaxID=1747226 RepID=UPI00131C8E4F|nr:M14 family zinc carboxypeptidase [Granulicella sp. S190]